MVKNDCSECAGKLKSYQEYKHQTHTKDRDARGVPLWRFEGVIFPVWLILVSYKNIYNKAMKAHLPLYNVI